MGLRPCFPPVRQLILYERFYCTLSFPKLPTDLMRTRTIILIGGVIAALTLGSMIDIVRPEGGHVTLLVLAPHPTPGFTFNGGEEGTWQRRHPNKERPWWLTGDYKVLLELD